MSNEIKDKAKEYLKAQLSVIPTNADKIPAINAWKPYQGNRMKETEVDTLFSGPNVKGLAIICGAVSGKLEVIDVDCKYDTTGALWDNLYRTIEAKLPELYSRMVIAKTKNKGYHIYYRCSAIQGNLKLLNRTTTEAEKRATYNKEIAKGATAIEATKRANNDKIRVLIETRGEGGYVIAPPTTGYEYIKGEPGNIPTITPEERESLFDIAVNVNNPFSDYDLRGDVVGLLESNGWTKVVKDYPTAEDQERVYFLRPGETDSKTSGNYHTGLRIFKVFSTSTEFEAEKGYGPAQVFTQIECNGDKGTAYKRLLDMGYGQPYNGDYSKEDSSKKTAKEAPVKEKPVKTYTLQIEELKTAIGEAILITSPGPQAKDEVLSAIDDLQGKGKRIYIREGDVEVREYKYQRKDIFDRYGTIQEENGGLTDRDKFNFLDEIVIISTKLQPIDKDVFLKEFIELDAIKELGISGESLTITIDRLTSTRDKEAQAKEFKKLLSDVTQLQDKGEVDKALELLDSKVKEVKLKDKATEFSSLLLPIKEDQLKERLSNKPESLNSGYMIGGEPLLLPSGAISILTAPTSHGKTTFLINLALNVAQAYQDKETYLFSYEEDSDSILINALNAYLDTPLSGNNRTTLKNHFIGANKTTLPGKDIFFKELIDTRRLNIHYTSYNSDTLIEAIRYLHKHAKPGAIFIDYIQLLNLPEGKYKTYSRQEEIKEICIALKDVAVETGLPIILGAQFNREVVNQLRIHATKIGEAGDIERIANLIVGFWNNNFMPLANEGELNEINRKGVAPNTLYTTILKNRGGRVGLEEILSFNGNTGKIKNSSSSGSNYFK
jgi:replicative DNA helicase